MGWKSDALLDRIVCQRSKNGGKTWSRGGGMGLTHPKTRTRNGLRCRPMADASMRVGPNSTSMEAKEPGDSTVILCSHSDAKGKVWSDPVRVSDKAGDCLDGDNTAEGQSQRSARKVRSMWPGRWGLWDLL